MEAPIYVTTSVVRLPAGPAPDYDSGVGDLLRQVLEIQKEQLTVLKAQAAAQDGAARWRAFLTRWQGDFPDVGTACKQVLPVIERAYLQLVQELTDKLRDEGGGLDNEFVLGEFLDRYGTRLGQLGTVLSQLGPLADAAPPPAQASG
ncbi:hypothetical protein [Fimbriiglobus ruber]|uniref:Uncharacterized protein n=1 Tax=Fimbriiglobus ruber TaxID=1908690 RepID=A0A225DL88_9BACT|nr:hypothetical protein [Fimbriiglobus ruber]OWK37939.1 hypothetical protein FRUB_07059 [Fimbriiglobus ruber]